MSSKGKDNAVEVGREVEKAAEIVRKKVKFEVFGEEMLEKEVKFSGTSGRVYLPSEWIGYRVKIIRVDCLRPEDECRKYRSKDENSVNHHYVSKADHQDNGRNRRRRADRPN